MPPKTVMPPAWPRTAMLQPGDHLRGGDFFFGLAGTIPQIVRAEHDDGVGDAGLRQHVAVEAAQAAIAPDIVQNAVPAEPLVHHRHRPAALPRHEPARELRGPAWWPSWVEMLASVSESPTATTAPVSCGATTSMPQTKYQSSVRRLTGMTSSAAKSPGGEM